MRGGPVYKGLGTVEDPAERTHYALLISHGDNRDKLPSRVSKYVEGPLPASFLDTLRLFTNQNTWDFMCLDDDGEWILEAILNGTL